MSREARAEPSSPVGVRLKDSTIDAIDLLADELGWSRSKTVDTLLSGAFTEHRNEK